MSGTVKEKVKVKDNTNIIQTQTEGPQPRHYVINIEREDCTVEYSPVYAFQFAENLLYMSVGKTTTVIPINENVIAVDVDPVYIEGV